MKKFRIQCGDLSGTFEGRHYKDAFRRAVKKEEPESLAELWRFRDCTPKGYPIGVWFYVDTMRTLYPSPAPEVTVKR